MNEYENALYEAIRVLGLAVIEMGGNRNAIQASLEDVQEDITNDGRKCGAATIGQLLPRNKIHSQSAKLGHYLFFPLLATVSGRRCATDATEANVLRPLPACQPVDMRHPADALRC